MGDTGLAIDKPDINVKYEFDSQLPRKIYTALIV
jgi:hypothetical protein